MGFGAGGNACCNRWAITPARTAAMTALTNLARDSGVATENQQYQTKDNVIMPSTLGYERPAASTLAKRQSIDRWLIAIAMGRSNQSGQRFSTIVLRRSESAIVPFIRLLLLPPPGVPRAVRISA